MERSGFRFGFMAPGGIEPPHTGSKSLQPVSASFGAAGKPLLTRSLQASEPQARFALFRRLALPRALPRSGGLCGARGCRATPRNVDLLEACTFATSGF